MQIVRCLFLGIAALLIGCASVQLRPGDVTVVMARDLDPKSAPSGIADSFSLDGKLVAYMSFKWADIDKVGGRQVFEARWYSAERLIAKREHTAVFVKQPYHVWFSVTAVDFAPGPAHFELIYKGAVLARKDFEILSK